MRKVLLATTALVALGGVSAAQAEVSISGYQNFEVTDSGTTSFFQDGEVRITGTITTDSGLTLKAVHALNTGSDAGLGADSGSQGNHVDDSYLDIAGEFGSLRMGNTDDVLDLKDGLVPSNWDEKGNSGSLAIGGAQGDNETISFTAPKISGIEVYGMTSAEGLNSGMGVNYSNGPIAVMYQMGDIGATSRTLAAVNFSMAGVTAGYSSGESEAAGGTKTKYTSYGVKYSMGAMDLYYTQQKDGTAASKNAIGGYYAIAPGLQAALESADNGTTTTTYAHLKVSF
jgi:hypothetical protein